ncbi:exopolyphosphatase [Tessaracoccus sp. OS52]|uniref:Ppx/GppA phosphatase family protein n=1 Tax=Tessaracoccus sp. OS52 TaxID=2886691 RepID=UPI001D12EBF0|nr:exopolyphosphatase [Tessaracoccus sp. OS52]
MSTTVAAIDCGTNSIRLLVTRQEADGSLTELAREVRLAQLGQGVDATGEFHPEALERTFAVCEEYAALIRSHRVDRTRFVATSAARDASNREALADGVRERLGVEVEVISGAEEARLSTEGVLSGVGAAKPVLVFDIGGGSTELIVVEEGRVISSSTSLDIGAVRITERFLRTDPPTADEQAAARVHIATLLDGAGVDFGRIETAIGVAGTTTSVAAHVLGLQQYSRQAVHRSRLQRDDIVGTARHWLSVPVAEITREPFMHPLRAKVIGGGVLILDEISTRVPGGSVLVSETDILDGIALGMLAE